MWPKIKIIVIAVLALLVLIIVLQNTQSVDTRILFMTITMPRAALLFGALVVGFVIGIYTAGRLFSAKKEKS